MKQAYILFTILFLSQSLLAQESETDTTKQLEEVLISANYLADAKTPISFQNVSLPLIQLKNVGQEPSFLLSETPSFTVYSDAGSYQGYSYFRLRGIDQTRINMTLDGIPLNEPEDQGVYFSNYPDFFNSIGGIQIQRGVGTSKNGTAGYAGSLQFASPNLLGKQETSVGLGYGSFNSYRAFAEHKSGLKENKAFYVRASKLYSEGYKYNSENSSESIFASGAFYGKKSTWQLTGFSGWQRNDMAWLGVSQADIDNDRRTNNNSEQEDDKFRQTLISLQNITNIGNNGILKTGVYYNYLKGNYDFDLNNFLGFPSTTELYNYAFQSDFGGFFTNFTLQNSQFTWTTGIHLNAYQRTHTGSERTIGRLYENKGKKNEASAYTKLIFQATEKLVFFTDLQVRNTSFQYEGDVALSKFNWNFFNPKAGISFLVTPSLTAYYSVGRTGREPTRTDMFIGEDNLLSMPNNEPLLGITEAEYVIDHELGLRISKAKWQANINGFYMNFKDEITLNGAVGPNALPLNNKVAKSIRTGIELDLRWNATDKLLFTNASSFIQTNIEDGGESFQHILTPSVILNQDVRYQLKYFNFGLSARYQSSSYLDFANEHEIDGYFLLNASIGFQKKGFQISLILNNLLDTEYYNNGNIDFGGNPTYFVQAPINGYIQVIYNF